MLESNGVESKCGAFQDASMLQYCGSGALTFLDPARYLSIMHTCLFKNASTPL